MNLGLGKPITPHGYCKLVFVLDPTAKATTFFVDLVDSRLEPLAVAPGRVGDSLYPMDAGVIPVALLLIFSTALAS